MKMFQKIQELIDDHESLVCVLIDEVRIEWVIVVIRQLRPYYLAGIMSFGHRRFLLKNKGIQGLKLRKYFRGQVGPYQINFGSPHNLSGAHQVCIVCLPPRLRGALRQGVWGPLKPWDKWCKILHSGHFLTAKLAIQKL
jgi:hypothetical protein